MRPQYIVRLEWYIGSYVGEWDESVRLNSEMDTVSYSLLSTFDKEEARLKFEQTKELSDRVEALEKALRDYGQHQESCNNKGYRYGPLICKCGWEAARKLLEGK